ncbi:hypothetical protein RFI_35107 [Reticulomyxa filosa]|uniref:Uncharacterized protein n=1 Tax=Reticulomyxa filosa TaxID=46433 RepID=X6LL34_RETFI|nr:hypothetical protein RFI_35107 [Reticulomyxa filosa]|eukprot:ETO02329.1 hypothetical protein RFI_35107 [Reticulomyxa filosa]
MLFDLKNQYASYDQKKKKFPFFFFIIRFFLPILLAIFLGHEMNTFINFVESSFNNSSIHKRKMIIVPDIVIPGVTITTKVLYSLKGFLFSQKISQCKREITFVKVQSKWKQKKGRKHNEMGFFVSLCVRLILWCNRFGINNNLKMFFGTFQTKRSLHFKFHIKFRLLQSNQDSLVFEKFCRTKTKYKHLPLFARSSRRMIYLPKNEW